MMDTAKISSKLNHICDMVCEELDEFETFERDELIEIVLDQYTMHTDLSDPDFKEFHDMEYEERIKFCESIFKYEYYGR